MLRSRGGDRGASAAEYGAILFLVSALVVALTAIAIPSTVSTNTRAAICRIFGGSNCGGAKGKPGASSPSPGSSTGGSASPGTGDGTQTTTGDDGDDTTDPAYVAARKRATDADNADAAAQGNWKEISKELLDFLADLVGITDAKKCITQGNIMSCLMTLVNVLPWGKIFKVLRKIPKAAKLIEKFTKFLEALNAARKERIAAEAAFKRIEDAIAGKVTAALAKACKANSFLPGTLVLMADGRHRPIEAIRPGDLVLATDPAGGLTKAEPVTAAFGGTNYQRLVHVALPGGGSVVATEHHRFWDPATGSWLRADQMSFGSMVRGSDGAALPVLGALTYPGHPEVRDLTVAELHTFYVRIGGADVLVHNAGVGCIALRKLAGAGNRYQTPAGLIYGDGSAEGHRLLHVLAHGSEDTADEAVNAGKNAHSLFKPSDEGVLGTVDEAWNKRYSVTPIQQGNRQVYIIPMGRVVGTAGEKYVRIVVQNGNEVITAFPQATGHL